MEMVESAKNQLQLIREKLVARELACAQELSLVHEVHRERARNLVHFWAFNDSAPEDLHERLESLGLDPLKDAEWDVLRRVDTVLQRLEEMGASLAGGSGGLAEPVRPSGREKLRGRSEMFFGPPAHGREVRIMVTLPAEAAEDPRQIASLYVAGAECFRINCARDDRDVWHRLIDHVRHEEIPGRRPSIFMDLGGSKLRVSSCAGGSRSIRLEAGDSLFLSKSSVPSAKAGGGESAEGRKEVAISDAAALAGVLPGHRIWFDDGKIGGIVRERGEDALRVEITSVRKGGRKLRLERGVNLPETEVRLPALTQKDLKDLPFVVRHADFLALSFVRTPADVHEFRRAVEKVTSMPTSIVIKIETREALRNLPRLMLAGMCQDRVAMLLARGDLAVECGITEMPRIQTDVVRYCAAAALPLFWATGIMERMSRTGEPSRAEMTDAVQAARAQCIMLNRGEETIAALHLLGHLLTKSTEGK
jgi:pyruvate kinase